MDISFPPIYDLEIKLLQPEVRSSVDQMRALLSDDFFEFCSSGSVYFFNKDQDIDGIVNSSDLDWEIQDFKTQRLAADVVLATYGLIKHNETRREMKYSLRSSIWRCIDGQWKMVFHQGTLTGEF